MQVRVATLTLCMSGRMWLFCVFVDRVSSEKACRSGVEGVDVLFLGKGRMSDARQVGYIS
jgi:hypothetical protein